MNDMEAFEAWHDDKNRPYPNGHECPHRYWERQAWQAALAYERAKQSATTNVGIDWANPATLNGSAPPAVQGEPAPFSAQVSVDYWRDRWEVSQEHLRRAMKQLRKWQEKYGAWQPDWLPPSGDMELADDIAAAPPAVQQQVEPVLLNLALRLRMARRCLKQALSSNANQRYIDQLSGAETEAWNSFQAAKAIAAPPAVQAEPGVMVDPIAWQHFIADYDRYNDGDPKFPFSRLRESLAAVIDSAAPPADDEAVRLLRKARYMCDDSDTFTRMALAKAIDAYLAKVGK